MRVAALGLAAACALGCRATWAPTTVLPNAVLQWPYAPGPPKVRYLYALTGLTRQRDVGSVLATVVLGRSSTPDRFVQPVAVAATKDGRIAVADRGRACVHWFVPQTSQYACLTGPARAPMVSPVGVAFDRASNLYVSDSTGRVMAFDEAGSLRFVLDRAGARPLQRPTGIAYGSARDNLYVVDTLAHEVDAFATDGSFLFSFGGRGTGPGEFNFPTHITVSTSGDLYVTDALNFRISIFDKDGHPEGAFGNHGDGSGDLAMPKGVAVDSDGVIYVVDALFDNVQLFDRKGGFLLTVGGRGKSLGEFWLPSGAFIGEDGNLYVCDTYNSRVQVFRLVSGYGGATS